MQACRSIDTRNPQRAKLALLRAAVAVSVLAGLDDCLLGGAIDLAAGVVVALRLAKNFLVTTPGRHSTFYSCHDVPLLVIRQQCSYTPEITFVDEARAAGTRMAFDLAVLVTEVVTALGLVVLEALRSLAETLRSPTVGFQLGHDLTPMYSFRSQVAPPHAKRVSATACGRTTLGPAGPPAV